jgi:hypothetical protein
MCVFHEVFETFNDIFRNPGMVGGGGGGGTLLYPHIVYIRLVRRKCYRLAFGRYQIRSYEILRKSKSVLIAVTEHIPADIYSGDTRFEFRPGHQLT